MSLKYWHRLSWSISCAGNLLRIPSMMIWYASLAYLILCQWHWTQHFDREEFFLPLLTGRDFFLSLLMGRDFFQALLTGKNFFLAILTGRDLQECWLAIVLYYGMCSWGMLRVPLAKNWYPLMCGTVGLTPYEWLCMFYLKSNGKGILCFKRLGIVTAYGHTSPITGAELKGGT